MATDVLLSVCSQCRHGSSATAKKSFLGFRKLSCPAGGHVDEHPLSSGYRGVYGLVLALMLFGVLGLLSSGQAGAPGVLSLAAAYPLIKDFRLREKRASAGVGG